MYKDIEFLPSSGVENIEFLSSSSHVGENISGALKSPSMEGDDLSDDENQKLQDVLDGVAKTAAKPPEGMGFGQQFFTRAANSFGSGVSFQTACTNVYNMNWLNKNFSALTNLLVEKLFDGTSIYILLYNAIRPESAKFFSNNEYITLLETESALTSNEWFLLYVKPVDDKTMEELFIMQAYNSIISIALHLKDLALSIGFTFLTTNFINATGLYNFPLDEVENFFIAVPKRSLVKYTGIALEYSDRLLMKSEKFNPVADGFQKAAKSPILVEYNGKKAAVAPQDSVNILNFIFIYFLTYGTDSFYRALGCVVNLPKIFIGLGCKDNFTGTKTLKEYLDERYFQTWISSFCFYVPSALFFFWFTGAFN